MGGVDSFEAARVGDVDTVSAAVAHDATVVAMRGPHAKTLLHVAAERNDVALAQLLLDAGADVEAEADWGHTPFEWAATLGSDEVATLLLHRGARRLNLWTASALGMLEVVRDSFDGETLLEGSGRAPRPGSDLSGWPIDGPFRSGDTLSDAFYIACRNGRLDVARFLRERGADVLATGYFGAPSLHWAAVNGHRDVVEWLLENGADPSVRDPHFDGDAAGWAREGGHTELAAYLEVAAR